MMRRTYVPEDRLQSGQAIRRLVEGKFGGGRVLVVGDAMLDVYLEGEVLRRSPESGMPIVRLAGRSEVAGGAANVAANFAGLGMDVTLCSFAGGDLAGAQLQTLLRNGKVDCRILVASDDRPTSTKTRILAGRESILRVDEEDDRPITPADEVKLIEAARSSMSAGISLLVLSDYDKGCLTERVCRTLIGEATGSRVPVLVDPKGLDFRKYSHATAITPNRPELERVIGRGTLSGPELRRQARYLRESLALDFVALTLAEGGVHLVDGRGQREFPAAAERVVDVSGAGDTLIAALGAGLAGGLDRHEAVALANQAAGIVVGSNGTTPIRRDELIAALEHGV